MSFTKVQIGSDSQAAQKSNIGAEILRGVTGGLSAPGTQSGNDAGSIAMNIASSTGEGALAGTAVQAGWGSLIGAVVGLGKGIVTSAIGAHKANEAEDAAKKANVANAETENQMRILNRSALLQNKQAMSRSAEQYYASLDPLGFTRAFTLGFTKAMGKRAS
jgi:hypothetical protein